MLLLVGFPASKAPTQMTARELADLLPDWWKEACDAAPKEAAAE
jgi:hypothetical protein